MYFFIYQTHFGIVGMRVARLIHSPLFFLTLKQKLKTQKINIWTTKKIVIFQEFTDYKR